MNDHPALFQVTYDDGRIELRTIPEILSWRRWSDRDFNKLTDMACGVISFFATRDSLGIPCDIERQREARP